MSLLSRFSNMLASRRLSRELDRELEFHLAERAEELEAMGLSKDEAMREARRRFGNRTAQKERAHDADVVAWLESVIADVRYAVRALVASPGFAFVAILSLGLGIGANSAIFSLTNALLLKPLPVSHPETLRKITMGAPDEDEFTNPLWEQLRGQTALFSGAFAYGTDRFNLAKGGIERTAPAAWVSGGMFDMLGVHPIAGRLIQQGDDVRGCAGVAAVSAGFAEREFGSAQRAVGQLLSLDGHPMEVVGVTDPDFFGVNVGRTADIYVPLCAQTVFNGAGVLDERSRWYLNVLVRAAPSLNDAQLAARLTAISPGVFAATVPQRYSAGDQKEYLATKLAAEPAATGMSDLRGRYKPALITLMVVVGIVLLIACANIANLLLARAAARQREIAVRLALGAGRRRIVRQLLTESVLLAGLGAAAGVIFASWASRLIVGFLTLGRATVWLDLSLDGRVLGFTVAVAVTTAVLFGLVPAWRATRVDPQAALKAGGRGAMGGDARHRIGRALVVAQVALSLALVAASGLLLGSFRRLVTLDPGFRREGLYLVDMDFGIAGYKDSQLVAVKREALRRIRGIPGVTSASASLLTPIGGMSWNEFMLVPGYSPTNSRDSLVWFNEVSDGYFATFGTALLAGRDFRDADLQSAQRVAVISETTAKRFFAGTDPVGRTFRMLGGADASAPIEVIGVVRDAKYQRLDEKTLPTAFVPLGQGNFPAPQAVFEVRTSAASPAVIAAVRSQVAAISPSISLGIKTMDAQVASSLARPRLLATLSAFFGALALLLAVVGLYGTMSYTVTRRRNEIGIRMALGAAGPQVLRMVVREAGRLIAAGIVAGALLAFAGTRFVASLLYGVTPTDPATFALSALALAVVAMAAAMLPAWRAARLDPMEALREE